MRQYCFSLLFSVFLLLTFGLNGCGDSPTIPEDTSSKTEFQNLQKKAKLIKETPLSAPFWSRLEGAGRLPDGIPQTDEWGIIFFYVNNPEIQVPHDFNLLRGFDPRAFAADFAVNITNWWQPGNTMAPYKTKLVGKGAVPFWIITQKQVQEVIADSSVTVGELLALDPEPVKGYAHKFNERQWPAVGGADVPGTIARARGKLEDGSKFKLYINTMWDRDVKIKFKIKKSKKK